MAIKRAEVRAVFEGVEGITDSHISKILSMVHAELDAVKDERDELQDQLNEAKKTGGNDAQKWEKQYNDLKAEYDSYKEDQTNKETLSAKKEAFKEILKDANLSEKGIEKAMKYSDFSAMELDEKGKLKGSKDILKTVTEEWSDYVTEQKHEGEPTPGAGSGGGKTTKSKEDIMNITDPIERQNAMVENHELFGF